MLDLRKKIATLKSQKSFLIDTYRDCYNYTLPMLGVAYTNYGTITDGVTNVSTANIYKAAKYDSTASDASKLLASFIFSNLCPSNIRWLDFYVENDPVYRIDWLDTVADLVWRNIHAGNFNSSGFECILHRVIGGQGILFQDMKDEKLHFELWDAANCYFEATVKGGMVDCVYREYTLKKIQAQKEFGDDIEAINACGDDDDILFIQGIYPRKDGEYDGLAEKKPFASCHILEKTGALVRESGFDEFPLGIPRGVIIPNSVYAFGEVYEALDDIKTLNAITQLILQNAEMAICGMYGAVDDGVINTGSIQVGPRKVILMAERDNMWSLNPSGNFQISESMQESQRSQVRRTMQVDQLQMPYQQGTTATEINTRTELLRQITGPSFGRLEEFLQAIVYRAFGLLLRAGKLPPIPEELKDLPNLGIKYVSPLARAQRNIEVQVIEGYEMSLAQTAQVTPSVMDVYNWDEGAKEKAMLRGVPERLMNNKKEINKIREDRSKQAQAQHEQQMQDEITLNESKKSKAA